MKRTNPPKFPGWPLPIERIGAHTMRFLPVLLGLLVLGVGIKLWSGGLPPVGAAVQDIQKSSDGLWQETAETAELKNEVQRTKPINYRLFKLDREALTQLLRKAPREFSPGAENSSVVLSLPLPDGSFLRFRIEESPSLSPELEASHPEIKSYRGQAIDHPATTMRCDLSPRGFHALIISNEGAITIHPTRWDQATTYISYQGQDLKQFRCDVNESLNVNPGSTIPTFLNGQNLRTYRLALATTQEYTNEPQLGGGTVAGAIAALNTTVNAMNVIYERELAIHLNMVTDNALIYTQEPDGFTNGNTGAMINEVPPKLVQVLGTANFDLGHVLGTNSGGLAGLGVVCNSNNNQNGVLQKGRGASGQFGPAASFSDVNLWAHEIGHQFGANHTFNGTLNNCSGGNRSQNTSWETGSGNTIMAYEGICGADNIGNDQGRFHVGSLTQILNYLSGGTGASCGIPTNTNNTPPTVSGGADRTIPKNTPFALTAIGTDSDVNDLPNLTYTWEQYDIGGANFFQNGTEASYNDAADPSTTTRPIFRSLLPTASPIRLFPSLSYILNNANDPPLNDMNGKKTAEELPRIGRTLNFRVTVRDNRAMGGGINDDLVTLTVDGNSGPFQVTAPNGGENWTIGAMQNITWNVNNTNNAPVNCTIVKISLSTDGGQTFPVVLAAGTPNDGAENIALPDVGNTATARIKIEAVGNIFFDISDADFAITGSGAIACPTINGLNPASGQLGFNVTITGTNFNGVTAVKFFNNVNAAFTIDSNTQITATVPPGAVTGPITVTRPTCTDIQSANFTVDATTCPNINGFAPVIQQPGGVVTITGTGFTGVSIVKFNNGSANFTVDNDTQISAIVPLDVTPGPISLVKTGCQTVQTVNFTPCNTSLSLQVDDGTQEGAGSFGAGEIFLVNRLTPVSYPATLNSVSIRIDDLQTIPQGTNITILAGTNTDGNNDIDNTVFQMVPAQVGTLDQFNSYNLTTPITINSGDFVVGFSINALDGQFPLLRDQTTPQGRSYRSGNGTNFQVIANNYNLLLRGQYTLGCGAGPSCPTVASINPANGGVGSQVVITGTNFTGVTGVKFSNNVTATFTVNNATQITATVPNGAVTGPITISKTACADVQTATFTVNAGCPTITLTPPPLPAGTVNTAYNQPLMATGGTAPYNFTLDTGSPATTRFDAAGPVNIPDNNPAGVDLPVTVSGITSAITKVTVSLQINHTFVRDLRLQLIGPDATTVDLAVNRGPNAATAGYGNACNPDASRTTFDDAAATLIANGAPPFVGTFRPDQMLAGFNGKSGAAANGQWRLRAIDNANQDTGVINCVSILITQTQPAPGLSLAANGTLSGTPTTAGTFNFTVKATDANNCMGTQAYALTIGTGGGGGSGLQFYPLARPVRLLETRAGQTGCDAPGAMIAGGTSRTQTAAGRTCDGLTIPANAKALTGNITTVESGGGYLTLFPSDAAQPLVANSNFTPNQVLNNVFTVGLGAGDGAFKIFVTSNTNVVVDVTGYYAPPAAGGLYFHPLPKPIRLLETRQGETGCFTPGAPLQAGSIRTQLGITTCDNVTIPAGAQALVGNATTVNPQTGGYLTFYPADATQPLVASSNFLTDDVMNAPFTVGLSPSGEFKVFTTSTTHLVIDVLGYYSTQVNDANGQGLLFNSLATPVRLLETRAGELGCFTPGAPMTGGTTYTQLATGACVNIPAAAKAVVGNATVVNANTGYLTFWPSNAAQPLVATSNFLTGQVFNRHFTVGLGADGAFKRYSSSTTDLVIDLSGYFAP